MQPNYKLIYFDARGRAELSRLIFAAAGVKFEDKRVSREEWPALKPAMPFGQLPVLGVNDKLFSQSSAIENFLAREFALYGKSSLEGLKIEEVIGIVHDYRSQMVRWYVETDNDRKEELYKSLQEQHLPRFLNIIERKLRNNVRGYIVGDRISLADLAVYDILEETSRRYPDVLDNFPQVKEHRMRIQSSQKISDYLKNRKETEF